MIELLVMEGAIFNTNISDSDLLKLCKGNEELSNLYKTIIENRIGIVVTMSKSTPSECELEKLYNAMLEVGGFEKELIKFKSFTERLHWLV